MKHEHWKQIVLGRYWRKLSMIAACGLVVCMMCGGWPAISLALGCETFPTVEEWEANNLQHEGFYSNCRYGYAVRIPAGVVGGVSKPHAPEHGIGIRYPQGMISVEGNSNSIDEWVSTDAVAETVTKWMTRNAKQVSSLEKQPVTLDGQPAIRLISRFECSDGTRMVNDYFLVMPHRGIIYTISLRADAAKYTDYKVTLEQVAASWQLREPWCEVVCGNAYPLVTPENWVDWESASHWGLHTDEYTNCDYGYTVTIPPGVVAKSAYPTTSWSGVGILLSRFGYLEVDGGYNGLKWISLDHAAETYVRWINMEAYMVNSVEKHAVTLGDVPAIRLTVRYECPVGTQMVKDLFLAMHGENVYKVDLVAEATKYEEYKPILEQIAGTFRLTDESCK